jgi:Holliday junction resolvase-like predicted endonuclease
MPRSTEAPTTGTQLQFRLLYRAKAAGWLVQLSRRSLSCRTDSSKGFPDLVLSKPGHLIFIECKSRYERLSEEQVAWAAAITNSSMEDVTADSHDYNSPVGGLRVEYRVARPQDYDQLMAKFEAGREWA